VARLQQRPWPGNVRELRNGVERLMILSAGKMVTGPDVERLLPVVDAGTPGEAVAVAPHTFETFKQEAEKNFLLQKLRDHDWNVSETARSLRMPRSNLYKKIERYGLRRESA
jgi:two-component system nitrogen regulation response regulator NtrX